MVFLLSVLFKYSMRQAVAAMEIYCYDMEKSVLVLTNGQKRFIM